MFRDEYGTWLVAESEILAEGAQPVTFLVALPDEPGSGAKAWAFWNRGEDSIWIGPRHTNFQDGSICAYGADDHVWEEGGDLCLLLDLYSVWALRHLHLAHFGRWPGKQYALTNEHPHLQAYYRLVECRPDELCGCGSETRTYSECCRPSDLKLDLPRLATSFLRNVKGGFRSRRPPTAIVEYAAGRAALPPITAVHLQLRASMTRSP